MRLKRSHGREPGEFDSAHSGHVSFFDVWGIDWTTSVKDHASSGFLFPPIAVPYLLSSTLWGETKSPSEDLCPPLVLEPLHTKPGDGRHCCGHFGVTSPSPRIVESSGLQKSRHSHNCGRASTYPLTSSVAALSCPVMQRSWREAFDGKDLLALSLVSRHKYGSLHIWNKPTTKERRVS